MTPPETVYYSTFPTPLGIFSVAVDSAGAVVATAFGDKASLVERFGSEGLVPDPVRTLAARTQLVEFLAGERRTFTVKTNASGTAFQLRVWQALRQIPYGQTRSYGQIAKALRTSARAVGRANATNPICIISPCHRVIGADGSLTGFAFGERIKFQLLELEGHRQTP